MRALVGVQKSRKGCQLWAALAAGALMAFAYANSAAAYSTFKIVHNFCSVFDGTTCKDGANPLSQLLIDQSGNLYSGPLNGGTYDDNGVVLLLSPPKWKWRVLHNFCAAPNTCHHGAQGDGSSGLISDVNGNFYGVTQDYHEQISNGILFKLSFSSGKWVFTTMYRFCQRKNCADGSEPNYDRLTYAGQGTGALWDGVSPLYGVAYFGGKYDGGVAYQMVPGDSGWKETVIHNFDYDVAPRGLIADSAGHLYGSAGNGGRNGGGFVYKLVQNGDGTWTQKNLHNYCDGQGCTRGPIGTLFLDNSHNLYGVTGVGGSTPYCPEQGFCGTAFELTSDGQYKEIYDFCSLPQCADGNSPLTGLTMDSAGNLLGVTQEGGTGGYCPSDQSMGCGTVFELTQNAGVWSGTALHSFCSQQDCGDGTIAGSGFSPGALTLDAGGNLFGTAPAGGNTHNAGIIFEIPH